MIFFKSFVKKVLLCKQLVIMTSIQSTIHQDTLHMNDPLENDALILIPLNSPNSGKNPASAP